MAEQEAVNFKVVGSSPARGAKKEIMIPPDRYLLFVLSVIDSTIRHQAEVRFLGENYIDNDRYSLN